MPSAQLNGVRPSAETDELPMERRNAVRYRLQIPAVFRWSDEDGLSHEGKGITRDLSDFGAYIHTATPPPPLVEVTLEIARSGEFGQKRRPLLTGTMKVVRVEESLARPGPPGFSLTGSAFRIYVESQKLDEV
jgi:hypothetical protein